ncbi:myosin phosphatase Rho-interacting protein-like isoform X6 [Hypanus sabinus]|uniref:myosin phosphatase Rho-interacting protein-like isoform X6 n=1 Tax=Hypanus sabinus TaxID=79690 RepID=UPI0028C3AA17|nr:myosin phosphatase Rho-interacting protein-like isoform X6 [Hypanus sabinus]
MTAKETAACRKFQANVFNQSKCQNCFKARQSHLASDQDLNQAKPIYGGWLLLAPEGTDFENPVQRSRKWQRRFFLLYEHGLLRYALDDSPTTLPQGTINMNLSTDVTDGESKTAQKNSVCIITPEKQYFIRAESKETINGWFETLIVYPHTNKQNQKKKRKVEPLTLQEPGPAKVAVTSSSIPSDERIPSTKSTLWQEEFKNKDPHVASTLPRSSSQTQSLGSTAIPKEAQGVVNGDELDGQEKKRVESGYFSLEKLKPDSKHLTSSPSSNTTDRYSPSESGMVVPCHSSLYRNSFLPTGNLLSNGSCISSSQSSLDSETSDVTVSIGSSNSRLGEHPSQTPAKRMKQNYAAFAVVPRARRISNKEAFQVDEQHLQTCSPGRMEVDRLFGRERRKSQVIELFESLEIERDQQMESNSSSESNVCNGRHRGRSEKRSYPRKRDLLCESNQISSSPDISTVPISQSRRAKSLDRRTSESTVTPDLLNFKKGWMTKLSADGKWKKHWFVLSNKVLKYYRDSAAEEAVDLDGEIDLSGCYDVTEYELQRNYGFQILTKGKVYTLSAMTSGIRRNWIQAIMKNVHPADTPDVTRSLPEEKFKVKTLFEGVSRNGRQTQQTSIDGTSVEVEQKKSRALERRKEGRSKTFDWADFRSGQRESHGGNVRRTTTLFLKTLSNSERDFQDLELDRARRREERRKRFETTALDNVNKMEVDTSLCQEPKSVNVEIENQWQQVESTPLREEKQIPIHIVQPSNEDRSPSQELTLMLEEELEKLHQEVSRLHEENKELQRQLKAAREREHSARDGYVLQATCERGFTAMEESHQKVIDELQKQHQRELEKLEQEKDRLLAEETAATVAAIEAMKNAHREELQRELEKTHRSQISSVNADIEALGRQHKEEMGSMQRELQVLSEQYSHKCLENAHLAQALEAERQALQQCQRENQELNAHNQELNNHLAAEFARLRMLIIGEEKDEGAGSLLSLGKDVYELEVLLRVKESEIQYLKQEINSLKDELQSALRDKKYATDKYKGIYTELSIVRAKADCDVNRLKEQLKVATEAMGEKTINHDVTSYDIMKSKSNPDFLKKDKLSSGRSLRSLRSKSLKEGLTVQERMKLFEPQE